MAHPLGRDSSMVARMSGGPDSERHHRICQMNMGFLPAAQGKVPCLGGTENDYTVPFTPHCIEQDAFLPFGNGNFASQDYRMKQPLKMLAYSKALQFWAEKNPTTLGWPTMPVGNMHERAKRIYGATDIIHQ